MEEMKKNLEFILLIRSKYCAHVQRPLRSQPVVSLNHNQCKFEEERGETERG